MRCIIVLAFVIVAAVAEQCGNTRDCKPSNCILGYTPICTSTNRCTCKMDMQTNPPTTTMAMATATTQGSVPCLDKADCQSVNCLSIGLDQHCVDGMCACI